VRRELHVLQRSLGKAQPLQQSNFSAARSRGSRTLNPLGTVQARAWSFQGLSWLWREPQKGNRSAAEGREGVTSSATAVETPVSTPQTPPPAQARTRKHPKLTSLPPESGPKLRIETGAHMIPNPTKQNKQGEDAYFIASDGKSFGVADGVGGWILSGVDSGKYSRLLMQMSEFFAESKKLDLHPKQMLWAAYKQTQEQGSSTACILKLKHDQLHGTNVGDSGFMVVRGSDVSFQSPHQQHSFNFPFQLGRQEPQMASETPARAQVFQVTLEPGDIVIAGSDGLFDNVFPEESAALVRHARSRGEPAAAAAYSLAQYTFTKACDDRHMSPFAYAAQAHGHKYVGGKLDDITIVVAYIGEAETTSSEPGSSGNGASSSEEPPPLSKM